ncbi:hypothetical protein B9G49_00720 [Halorubrum sp. SD683]|nr:hypothetical protein B9G49_00720 [Halorubrum sp. SD683]
MILPNPIHLPARWGATELLRKAVYLIHQVLIGESEFPVWSVASLTKRLVPTPEFVLADALRILSVLAHLLCCRRFS